MALRNTMWSRLFSSSKKPAQALLGLLLMLGLAAFSAIAQEPDYALYQREAKTPERKLVGPLVGHVTDSSAKLWCYAGPGKHKLAVVFHPLNNANDLSVLESQPDPDRHSIHLLDLKNLKPNTEYGYWVSLMKEGRPVASAEGKFRTAPPLEKPAKFRVAIVSCSGGQYRREKGITVSKRTYPGKSWDLLLAEQPDCLLLLGDNVYADSTDYNHHWDSHTLERLDNQKFANAIRNIPTYAIWDDHDYGPNNSDGTAPGKENSLRAFQELFANPSYGTRTTPGVFTHFARNGVEFFLLDDRYHRSPNKAPNDDKKRFFGDEQFNWLVEKLKASQAKFKVLVCGSTWQAKGPDSLSRYDFARRRLLQAIVDHRIEGVVFTSGDIHRSEIQIHPPEVPRQYPIFEIISSGIGSHGANARRSFAIVDFDTTCKDPEMMIHILEGDGREVGRRLVRLSQLRVPRLKKPRPPKSRPKKLKSKKTGSNKPRTKKAAS